MNTRRMLEWGGILSGLVLIVFGVVAITMGVNAKSTVTDNLKAEQIYYGDAAKDPTVPKQYSGQLVDSGAKARAFAKMMRGHTLESTSGKTYSQMGRFQAADGKGSDGIGGTDDPKAALIDAKTKQPVSNPARSAHDRAQRQLHGRPARLVRRDRRRGPAADRHRARDPRADGVRSSSCGVQGPRTGRASGSRVGQRDRRVAGRSQPRYAPIFDASSGITSAGPG